MKTPRLYLAVDNCFAIKRWVEPRQWMPLIRDLGAFSIEASTDNEFDPIFAPQSYKDDWLHEVQRLEDETGTKVRTFFTGYQTYRTVGLAHPDSRVRTKLRDEWFKPLILTAQTLDADIGFALHAMRDVYLQDPQQFQEASRRLVEEYAELATFAHENGGVRLCCEQMYAPHQTPWTIDGARQLMKDVYAESNSPFYIAIDVGHMVGQPRFKAPSRDDIMEYMSALRTGRTPSRLWLGPMKAYEMLHDYVLQQHVANSDDTSFAGELIEVIRDYPHLFCEERDADPYGWLRELGGYSPIIHLQQTDGISSSHAPFTAETNREGIITGEELLHSLAQAYEAPGPDDLPDKSDTIVLALEIFVSNVEVPFDALESLKESVSYWRQFIPEDGIPLADAVRRVSNQEQGGAK